MNSIVPVRLNVPHPEITLKKDVSEYTEVEKMVHGLNYNAMVPELINARLFSKVLLQKYKNSDPSNIDARYEMLKELLGTCSNGVYIEPPFYCDNGPNIHLGENVGINYNCRFLDGCKITVGARTLFAPGVQVYTDSHAIDPIERRSGEFGKAITIGKDCWIGGCAIILPGVTIGDGCTIGAGSVVTKNVESFCVVAGNPARVIKRLDAVKLD